MTLNKKYIFALIAFIVAISFLCGVCYIMISGESNIKDDSDGSIKYCDGTLETQCPPPGCPPRDEFIYDEITMVIWINPDVVDLSDEEINSLYVGDNLNPLIYR